MGHPTFDMENWQKISANQSQFSYNKGALRPNLGINATKFYFYLKERFGVTDISYESIAKFFPARDVISGREWAYIFRSSENHLIIVGDDQISLSVLSLNSPPEEVDFDIFVQYINQLLDKFDLKKYHRLQYDNYLNYSYILRRLINQQKEKVKTKLPYKPPIKGIDISREMNSEYKYEQLEYRHDYNQWVDKIVERATSSLQLKILYPIYIESLVDLAFRIKLKASNYSDTKKFFFKNRSCNIFELFELINIFKKLKLIGEECFQVSIDKLEGFISTYKKMNSRKDRNKLLHGNSLTLKNLERKFYFDENFIIGVPDRHKYFYSISEAISSILAGDQISELIENNEELIKKFMSIFDDDGYFENLALSLSFSYNSEKGGTISSPVQTFELLKFTKD